MPTKDPSGKERMAGAASVEALLGPADGETPRVVTLESLNQLTLKQLVDGAKRLGVKAVSKLKKDALVKAVLEAWHANGAGGGDVADGVRAPEGPVGHPLSHKFEVGQTGRASTEAARELLRESAKEIPWGYGGDRVTALPVDPERLFAYWEVLDDSIAAARDKLGPGGPGAWLNLRVYDVSGRIFDGTNAHGFFDHTIQRGDRQWFFAINRPTSEAIIEIGMKSHEGYFVKIARSGKVEFPRREPAAHAEPEWLTVRVATGQVEHGGIRMPARPGRITGGTGLSPTGVPFPGATAFDLTTGGDGGGWRGAPWRDAKDPMHPAGETAGGDRHEWEEVRGDGAIEEFRRFHWDGPATITSWEAGPFSYPVEIPEPVRESLDSYEGKTRVLKVDGRTHVLYGPWQVIIRGLGAQQARVVLSRWEVYRTWADETGHHVEQFSTTYGRTGAGASERMVGSSERRWVGGSEARLGGSSEVFFLKASELRLGGASELAYAGSSQWVMRGASERLFAGASERVHNGASEQLQGRGFLGGSEGRLGGGGGAAAGRGELPAGDGVANAASQIYPQPPGGSSSSSHSKSSREGS
ncbi:MAG: DUF4912 domain-containing protein [Myxococcales bacterium]